jgi:hypothetical protein
MCFFEVVEEIQSKCPNSNELECLLVIEEKIHEVQKNADKQLLGKRGGIKSFWVLSTRLW